MSEPILTLNVSKRYPEFAMDLTLAIKPGEFFSIIGPSGCGKTTLLRLIAGLEQPDRGEIIIGGKDITLLPPARRRVGLVFQDYALFPHLTVTGNIEYGLKAQGSPAGHSKAMVSELLGFFELEKLSQRTMQQLSGGERQRVAIARALAPQPLVLLMDEPFSALDYGLRRRLRTELKNLQASLKFTVIFVTHQQEEALAISDRLGVMQNGKIIQVGTPKEVYENPASSFVAGFLGDANLIPCRVESQLNGIKVFIKDEWSCDLPCGGSVPPSGDYRLMVRPEDVLLEPLNSTAISGEILAIEYLGFAYYLEIMMGNYLLKAVIEEQEATRKACPLHTGALVSIAFNLQFIRLIALTDC